MGTMPGLEIGQAQGAALPSLEGFVYPTDVESGQRWFRDDIVEPCLQYGTADRSPKSQGAGL